MSLLATFGPEKEQKVAVLSVFLTFSRGALIHVLPLLLTFVDFRVSGGRVNSEQKVVFL